MEDDLRGHSGPSVKGLDSPTFLVGPASPWEGLTPTGVGRTNGEAKVDSLPDGLDGPMAEEDGVDGSDGVSVTAVIDEPFAFVARP